MSYGVLNVGGISSINFDIYVLAVNDANVPERDYTAYSIPGRSRDLHYDNDRWRNIDRTYSLYARTSDGTSAEAKMLAFVGAVMRKKGYQKITDSMHPEYYKKGEFKGGINPKFSTHMDGVRFDMTFDCDARKYLLSGETEITLANEGRILINPGSERADPLFKVTGSGTIAFSGITMTVASHSGTMVIDCELGDAYGSPFHENLNQYLTLSGSGEFPMLNPGSNYITISGLSSCKIVPRWCKL